ncbi:hypothetical protein G9A89_001170 [Geosiphon pyriformis]|nr:hypothetical protein G9A89_001170 [Geosiphon pyriformis]
MGTIIHDLKTLLENAGRKTCVINRSIKTDNRIHYAVVSFDSNNNLESVFHTKSIFNGVKLSWARMNLVCCKKCRHFGYLTFECNASDISVLSSSKKSYKKVASKEAPSSSSLVLDTPMATNLDLGLKMILDDSKLVSLSPSFIASDVSILLVEF